MYNAIGRSDDLINITITNEMIVDNQIAITIEFHTKPPQHLTVHYWIKTNQTLSVDNQRPIERVELWIAVVW